MGDAINASALRDLTLVGKPRSDAKWFVETGRLYCTRNNSPEGSTRIAGVVHFRRLGGCVSRRTHQDRFVEVTTALGQLIRTEVQMPSDRVVVDVLLEDAVVPGLLGAVGEEVSGHTVAIEHFSRPPNRVEALRALVKAALLRNELSHEGRATVSLVVACRRSIGALHAFRPVADETVCGWWRLNMHVAQIHILSAQALPSDGTWGAFRFATNPPGPATQDLMAELIADPRLTTISKQRLIEAVMKNQISNVNEADTRSAYQRAVDIGITQGRRDEQEAMLAQLSTVLAPAVVASLRHQLGSAEFVQALAKAISAQ